MSVSGAGSVSTLLAVAGPLFFLAHYLIPKPTANRLGVRLARTLAAGAFVSLLAGAASLVLSLVWSQPARHAVSLGGLHFGLTLDPLSYTLLLLVSFLAAVVATYTVRHLAGDPGQGNFAKWLAVTIGSAQCVILSGNLLAFAIAWAATSLGLHQLLTFYPNRPGAVRAARKKFLISRLGDACLAGALILTWRSFGSWDFAEVFSSVSRVTAQPGGDTAVMWIGLLLAGGAVLKSAQFPFHTWLPDTMETPVPVSALMHAGIINAGGFLVLRFSPLLSESFAPQVLLAVSGGLTAAVASVIMLTQTSVKRSLAYSTIAQMGFMMLQCGLGAYAVAVLHIVAHSLYKAHAFLSAGGVLKGTAPVSRPSTPLRLPVGIAALGVAALAVSVAYASLVGSQPLRSVDWLFLGILVLALAHLLWNAWASGPTLPAVAFGVLLSFGVAGAYFGLHTASDGVFHGALPRLTETIALRLEFVGWGIALLFVGVFLLQARLERLAATRAGRALYVHASNGFYLGALFNRLLSRTHF